MADLARVRTVWAGVAGTPYYTNLYFPVDPTTHDVSVSRARVRSFIFAMQFHFSSSVGATVEPDVTIIDSTTGLVSAVVTDPTPQSVVGRESDALLPLGTQGLFTFDTGAYFGGRRLKGKLFFPAPTAVDNQANGTAANTYLSDGGTAITALIGTGGTGPVIYSPTYHAYAPIVSGTVHRDWTFLRSRKGD